MRRQNVLASLILNKKLILRYDVYQDDKFGRILAYLWISYQKEIEIFVIKIKL